MICDLIDFRDMTLTEWEEMFKLGLKIYDDPAAYSEYCKGRILA